MKKVLTHKYTHYLLILVVAFIAGYAYFGLTRVGEAEIIKTIGSIKVTLDPEPPTIGTEFVSLQYNGWGVTDISGWSIENENGLVFTLPETILNDTELVKICSHKSVDTTCDYEWEGGFIWGENGTLKVIDDTGSTRLLNNYTGATTGIPVDGDIRIDGIALTKNDSIDTCHSANGDQYSKVNGNVSNIAKGKGGHGEHVEYDIIPPFLYFVDGVLGYYQGMNWEEKQTLYEANCGKK